MSTTLIDRAVAFVQAGTDLTNGYSVKKLLWTDAAVTENTPFILFRQSGSGPSSVLLQDTQISIILCQLPAAIVDGDTRIQQIARRFREHGSQAGVVRFDPVGAVMGPFKLENGRPWWELVISSLTEDQ